MHYIAWEEFWWNNITGAHTVVDRVVMALLDNKMVGLKVPSDLPWRYAMRSAIQTGFNEHTDSRDIVIETIDVADRNPANLEPGRFILQNYATSAVKAGYREKARISIQDYISSRNVIKNRIIWIKGLNGEAAYKWLQFCRGFSPKCASDGLFVLELPAKISVPESKFIQCIDFDNCVSSYDVQQFNSFVLDDQKDYPPDWRRYISAAAAAVCGVDSELSEMLLKVVDYRVETAIDGLQRIDEMGDFARRGMDKDSDHPLWHFRNNNIAELLHRIWTAQIQVLFPIIELERQKLIGKWYTAIETALAENEVRQFGTVLSDPSEAELGTLCFMISCKVHGDYRMLYIPDGTDRSRIRFLHACRNKLAHMSCCSPEEIRDLLDPLSAETKNVGFGTDAPIQAVSSL